MPQNMNALRKNGLWAVPKTPPILRGLPSLTAILPLSLPSLFRVSLCDPAAKRAAGWHGLPSALACAWPGRAGAKPLIMLQ